MELFVWNFKSVVTLPEAIRFEIYEKQPELGLKVEGEVRCEESSLLMVEGALKAAPGTIPLCLIKLSLSVYFSVDVGFQENEVVLSEEDGFKGIDFSSSHNVKVMEGRSASRGSC